MFRFHSVVSDDIIVNHDQELKRNHEFVKELNVESLYMFRTCVSGVS